MRYLPLDDSGTQDDAGEDRRPRRRVAVRGHPCRQADRGPARSAPRQERDGGRADALGDGVAQSRRGLGAVLPRRRGLQAPYSGERRSPDPALRIPDQLYALSAGDRPGHAEGPVRVPDAGRDADRHGCRKRLDVRRLDRLRRSDADGAPADEARQGGAVRRPASAIFRRRGDAGANGRGDGRAAPRTSARARTSRPRSTTRRPASSSRPRISSATPATSRRSPPPRMRGARC